MSIEAMKLALEALEDVGVLTTREWQAVHKNKANELRQAIATTEESSATQEPKREWVGLTEQERNDIEDLSEMMIGKPAFDAIEKKLKEKNI